MASSSKGLSHADRIISDTDEFCKQSLGSMIAVVRASHSLPKAGDDYEFYCSFPGFQEFVSYQKDRLLKNISTLMKNNGFKDNFVSSHLILNDADDYMDNLIESNDGMLERVSTLLDSFDGKQPMDTNIAVPNSSKSDANSSPKTVVSSWNKTDKYGQSKTFKLLQAHNIIRPQLRFKDYIDNANTPFVPKIRVKPNALKPLSKALLEIDSSQSDDKPNTAPAIASLLKQVRQAKKEDVSIYLHPYQYELSVWEPLTSQLEKVEPIKPAEVDPDSCIFIDKPSQLNDLLSVLRQVKEIAVDLEAHTYRSFQGITCLLQISTREQDYIVDTLALRSELHVLNEVMTNPEIVKVFHGANSDVVWLQRDFGLYVVNMFDTGLASRTLSLPRHSLDHLAQRYCDVHFDKKYQLADWRIRPLPSEMLFYAQGDTHYLLYIYDVMKNELLEQANGEPRLLRHVLNRSRDLCLLRYEKPLLTSESHLTLLERNKRRGNAMQKFKMPQQTEALRLIYAWRDSMARQEDESCGYILPNHMLLQIAEILPREAQGVLACCNPIPPLLRQHVMTVHQLVVEARATTRASAASRQAEAVESPMPVPAKPEHDYANLLTCPHDLSHSGQKRKSSSFKSKPFAGDGKLLVESSLFGPFNESSLLMDGVCLFEQGNVRCAMTKTKENPNFQRKKSEILKDFSWDPFALFMPSTTQPITRRHSATSDDVSDDAKKPLSLKRMLNGEFKWKMRKLDIEEDKEEEEESKKPKDFGTVVKIPKEAQRNTEEQIESLKSMLKSQKKASKKSANEPIALSSPAVTYAGLPPSLLPTPPTPAEQGKKPQGDTKRGKKGKSKKRARESQPFAPHQYSNEDYKQFQRKSDAGRKKRRFNK